MKWIKFPGPGEFRGEGMWYSQEELGWSDKEVQEIENTRYLPVLDSDTRPEPDDESWKVKI